MPSQEVFRITDYGGEVTQSVGGGACVEYWACKGLSRHEFDAAHALGLPKVGFAHHLPEMWFVGTVQAVTCVQEKNPNGWIARVVYSQGGTFNFTTRIGNDGASSWEQQYIPVMGVSSSGGMTAWYMKEPFLYLPRACFTITKTFRTGVESTTINQRTAQNLGALYDWDGIPYRLHSVRHHTNENNETRVETRFLYRGPMSGWPANHYAGNSVAIVPLPPNADWTWDTRNGSLSTNNPAIDYGIGDDLPWLE